jgi:hypothetical protein
MLRQSLCRDPRHGNPPHPACACVRHNWRAKARAWVISSRVAGRSGSFVMGGS